MKTIIVFETIIGYISVIEDNGYITDIIFGKIDDTNATSTPLLLQVKTQILEYLAGNRKVFDFPITFSASPFTESVWQGITQVPYGKTITYSQLASLVGNPQAQRAVGTACGKNRLTLIIPCHRIIGKTDGIGGFGGDVTIKKALLALESKYSSE